MSLSYTTLHEFNILSQKYQSKPNTPNTPNKPTKPTKPNTPIKINAKINAKTIPRHNFSLGYSLKKSPEALFYQNRFKNPNNFPRHIPCPNQRFEFAPYQKHYGLGHNKYINPSIYEEPINEDMKKAKLIHQVRLGDRINSIILSVNRDVKQMDKYEIGYPDPNTVNNELPKTYSEEIQNVLQHDDTNNIDYEAFNVFHSIPFPTNKTNHLM